MVIPHRCPILTAFRLVCGRCGVRFFATAVFAPLNFLVMGALLIWEPAYCWRKNLNDVPTPEVSFSFDLVNKVAAAL